MNIRYQIKIHKEKTLGMAQIVHLKEDSFLVTNPTTLHAMQCSAWVFPSFLYKVHKPATRVNAGARFQVLAPT